MTVGGTEDAMKRRTLIITVALLWLFSTGLAFGAPVGKFTAVKGLVDLTSTDGVLREVKIGDPVSVGDIVRTKTKSSAEITFADSSVVRLARNSRLKINEYMVGEQETHGILKLFRGKAQSIVSKAAGFFGFKKKNKFEMHTPTAVCGVRGTNFFTWYSQGTSGVAVKEGTVYNYAANKPTEVKEVRAGQSSIVVSADEDPVVGAATDDELSLGDEEEEGTPSAFMGEPEEDLFASGEEDEEEPLVEVSDTTEIVPEPPLEVEPDFELQLSGGFLTGTLTGDDGTLDLSGTYTSASAANTMAVGGDQSNGGSLEGYLGGVLGSWEGLFNSIYVDPDGGAGFIYGALSGDVTGSQLSATGTMTKTAALGTVADPAAELELDDFFFPVPLIGTPDTDPTVEGLLTANVDNADTERWLGVFSLTATDAMAEVYPTDVYDFANDGNYGTEDVPYYMAGYLDVVNDGAGHLAVDNYAFVNAAGKTVTDRIFYLDPLYHGTYDMSYRGVYDTEGNISLAGSGMFVLDPLDYSGSWGSEGTLYFNDSGLQAMAAFDDGLMGLVASATGYDFYAAGKYSMDIGEASVSLLAEMPEETGSFIWSTEIGGPDQTGGASFLEGFTAGVWQHSTNSYNQAGDMVGAAAALKFNIDGSDIAIEQLFGDLRGEYFTGDDRFRVRGDLEVTDSLTVSEANLLVIEGALNHSLAGSLGAAGAIDGAGGGYLEAYLDMDPLTRRGLGIFEIGFGDGSLDLLGLDLPEYVGNTYTGRAGDAQTIDALVGGAFGRGLLLPGDFDAVQVDSAYGGGYFMADVNGTLNADGSMTTDLVNGKLLTTTFVADMAGSVFGQGTDDEEGDGNGTWIGQGVGTLDNVTALAFSGVIDYASDWDQGPYYGLYSGDYGFYLDTWDDVYALVGSTQAPWRQDGANWIAQPTDVLIMGDAWDVYPGGQFIWNDELYSWNALEDDDTTYDGGSFNGFVGGVFNGGMINGRVATLYIDPGGNAGVMTGAADGEYYSDLEMMRAGGTWTPVQMASAADLGILPADFYDAVQTDATMNAMAAGNFNGSGYLNGATVPFGGENFEFASSGSYGGGWTRFIDGQDWGIYDFILSGYQDDGGGYDNEGGTSWSAVIGGTAVFGSMATEIIEAGIDTSVAEFMPSQGYWLGGIVNGAWNIDDHTLEGMSGGSFLTATHMGTLGGEVFGYFDDEGNWAATSLGVFDGEPLAYSGYWSMNEMIGGIHNIWANDYGSAMPAGLATGLLGGVQDPLSATSEVPADFLAMGEYDSMAGDAGNSLLFRNTIMGGGDINSILSFDLTSLDEPEETPSIFLGFTTGLWNFGRADGQAGGTMDGAVAALYFVGDGSGSGTAGLLANWEVDDSGLDQRFETYFQDFGDFYDFDPEGDSGMWMAQSDLYLLDSLEVDESASIGLDIFLGAIPHEMIIMLIEEILAEGEGLPGFASTDLLEGMDIEPMVDVPMLDMFGSPLATIYGSFDDGGTANAAGIGLKLSVSDFESGNSNGVGTYAFGFGNLAGFMGGDGNEFEMLIPETEAADVTDTGNTGFSGVVGGIGVGASISLTSEPALSLSYYLLDVDAIWGPEDENSESGEIFGMLNGNYISLTEWGAMNGPLFGVYDVEEHGDGYKEGTWIANSVGTYQATALDFSGTWGHLNIEDLILESLLFDANGDIGVKAGHEWGLVGLMAREIDGEPADGYNLVAMGQYVDYGDEFLGFDDKTYVWSSSLYGGPAYGAYVDVDGVVPGGLDDLSMDSEGGPSWNYGELAGFTIGFWKDAEELGPADAVGNGEGTMEGYSAILYFTEDGAPGLLTGLLDGSFYRFGSDSMYGIGMWQAGGLLSEVTDLLVATDFNPENAWTEDGWMEANLIGQFISSDSSAFAVSADLDSLILDMGGLETITGDYYSGTTKFIAYDVYDGDESSTNHVLPWGIYNLKLGDGDNFFAQKPEGPVEWEANVGGEAEFYERNDDCDNWDTDFWLASITGTWNEEGTIDGALSGQFLTSTHLGSIDGVFYGLYTQEDFDAGYGWGTWVGASVGTYVAETALDYGATWGDGGGCLQSNDDGNFTGDIGDWAEGRLGLISDDDGYGGYDLVGMGYFEGGYDEEAYLWWPKIQSGGMGHTGNGEPQLYGFTGTVWKDGDIFGDAVALWVTPDGQSAGLLWGELLGSYSNPDDGHDGLWKFNLEDNNLASTEIGTTVLNDPEEGYVLKPHWAPFEGRLAGTLDGVGATAAMTISMEDSWEESGGSKLLLVTEQIPEDCDSAFVSHSLGAYWLKLESGYAPDNMPVSTPGVITGWSAVVGGIGPFTRYKGECMRDNYGYWLASVSGTWEAGIISGQISNNLNADDVNADDVFARYLTRDHFGTLTGNFLGIYDEYGWIAESVGYFSGDSLGFSADWGGEAAFMTSLYGFDGSNGYVTAGHETGILGGVFPDYPDESSAQLYAMGEFEYTEDGSSGTSYIWLSDLGSGDYPGEVESVEGYTAGLWSNRTMGSGIAAVIRGGTDGTAAALYTSSDLAGNYYDMGDGGGLWKADGTLQSGGFTDEIDGDDLTVNSGSYGDNDGAVSVTEITYSNVGSADNWWVQLQTLSGTSDGYDGASNAWNLLMEASLAGIVEEAAAPLPDFTFYSLASGTGWDEDDDDRIQADLAGAWINWGEAVTGVSGGSLTGLFNPSDNSWKAVAAWTYMDTETFLATVQNNPQTLEDMNIPSFEVGVTSFAGSGENLPSVYMNNILFIAHQGTTNPSIWASDNVGGQWSADPSGKTATLTSANVNGNLSFTMDQFDAATGVGGKWGATVNGSGLAIGTAGGADTDMLKLSGASSPMNGTSIDMQGAAAGTIDTLPGTDPGTFTGTAAGVVTGATAGGD